MGKKMGAINVLDHNYGGNINKMVWSTNRLARLIRDLVEDEHIREKASQAPCQEMQGIVIHDSLKYKDSVKVLRKLRDHLLNCDECMEFLQELVDIARIKMGDVSIFHRKKPC